MCIPKRWHTGGGISVWYGSKFARKNWMCYQDGRPVPWSQSIDGGSILETKSLGFQSAFLGVVSYIFDVFGESSDTQTKTLMTRPCVVKSCTARAKKASSWNKSAASWQASNIQLEFWIFFLRLQKPSPKKRVEVQPSNLQLKIKKGGTPGPWLNPGHPGCYPGKMKLPWKGVFQWGKETRWFVDHHGIITTKEYNYKAISSPIQNINSSCSSGYGQVVFQHKPCYGLLYGDQRCLHVRLQQGCPRAHQATVDLPEVARTLLRGLAAVSRLRTCRDQL